MVIVVHTDIAVSLEKCKHPMGSRQQNPGAPWHTHSMEPEIHYLWHRCYPNPCFVNEGTERPAQVTQLVGCNTGIRVQVGIQSLLCCTRPIPSSWLTDFTSHHYCLSPWWLLCTYLPSPPRKHTAHRQVCTHACSFPWFKPFLTIWMSSLSSAFPETALASVLSPKFYLLTTCSSTNLSLFKTSVCLLHGMLWHLVSCCSLMVLSVWLVFPVRLKAAQE